MEMILQNVLMPCKETCLEEELYFRRNENVEYFWYSDHIKLKKNAHCSFDTYFNSLTLEKWKKYTSVGEISLHLRAKGTFFITFMRKERLLSGEVITEWLGEELCESEEIEDYQFDFHTLASQGSLCYQLTTLKSKAEVYDAYYYCNVVPEQIKPVRLALDICTFKREAFIAHNLMVLNNSFLKNEVSPLYGNLEVFISDNAGTLDRENLQSESIHIFPNKNVGGAGGFTRGMIEIRKVQGKSAFTHILVMDDDIRIEPEAIYRTYIMLSLLKENYQDAFIGGAMLRLDTPYIQVESGGQWNGGELVSLKGGLDLRNFESCLYNEMEESPQFNAWWYCAFPADIVTDENLPMPIFIRGDDVEYGLRNMKHLILMNGICVWHEAFERKYSSFIYYYILRNRFMDNAVRNIQVSTKQIEKLLSSWVMPELRLYRYKNADLIMQGVEDFLKGPEWLMEQDGEQLHKKVMAAGYKMQYIEETGGTFNYPLYEASLKAVPMTSFKQRMVSHYTLNGTYLKPTRSYSIVPLIGTQESAIYRTEKVLNYDYESRKGFMTYRSPEDAKRCVERLKTLKKRIEQEYVGVAKQYLESASKLNGMEFWKKYLDI